VDHIWAAVYLEEEEIHVCTTFFRGKYTTTVVPKPSTPLSNGIFFTCSDCKLQLSEKKIRAKQLKSAK
jgi:hypothetical protein